MKMFDQMTTGQAVKIEDKKYLVALGSGEYETSSGVRFSVNNYNGTQMVLDSVDGLSVITKTPALLIGYSNEDGSEFGSIQERNALTSALRQYQDGVDDGYRIVDLEYEYDLRRKIQAYETKKKLYSEPGEMKTPITISVIGDWIDPGSDFIISSYSVGDIGYYASGPYKLLTSAVAKDEIIKMKGLHPTIDIPSHSGVRYVKCGASFVFDNSDENKYAWIKNGDKVTIFKTLEEAIASEKSIRSYVRKKVNMIAKPIKAADMSHEFVTEIINDLSTAWSLAIQVDSTKKTASTLISLRSKLTEISTKLKNLHED